MKLFLRLLGKISFLLKHWKYKRKLNDMIAKGLKVGKNVTIMPGATIDDGYPYLISIGNNCSLSNGVLILAHDATTFKFTDGYTRIGKVEIRDNCFIGSNVVILPGVTIGPNVLIAAGSVINKDIPPNSCVAGVPARTYAKFDEFIDNQLQLIKEHPSFEFSEFATRSSEFIERITRLVNDRNIYVRGYPGKFPWTIQ